MPEKLTYEEFLKQAIVKLRTGDYKGIHTVYSGFNGAFRKYFGGCREEAGAAFMVFAIG